MKIGVILSGCGVYDGSEIHEAVFTLLAIAENGAEAVCCAPDVEQHHVVNHLTGEEMDEKRNVMIESARISRGDIQSIKDIKINELDALIIPGGFGAAKNLTKWAFSGPDGEINILIKEMIIEMVSAGKPVGGFCMGPTVIAKALQGSGINATLTVGTTKEKSPYDIAAISQGMEIAGATAIEKTIDEIAIDEKNKIVSAPCYMMEADILQVRKNIKAGVDALIGLIG